MASEVSDGAEHDGDRIAARFVFFEGYADFFVNFVSNVLLLPPNRRRSVKISVYCARLMAADKAER